MQFFKGTPLLLAVMDHILHFRYGFWLISTKFRQFFLLTLVVICRTYITYLFWNHTVTFVPSRVIFKPDDFVMESSGMKHLWSCKCIHLCLVYIQPHNFYHMTTQRFMWYISNLQYHLCSIGFTELIFCYVVSETIIT